MRLLPWRPTQPQDPASLADRANLQARLARLTKPPVQDAGPATKAMTAPISRARAKLHELTGGAAETQGVAPIDPERTETKPPLHAAVPSAPAVTMEPVAAAAAPAVTVKPVA